jgi:ubiquinone/menaquinone biosynthesis C-methylase UbiE
MALGRLLHGAPHADTPGQTIGPPRIYEAFVEVFFAGRRRGAYTRLVELSGARPGDRVLDVGCGTGYLTRLVAKAVGPGGKSVGVDPSPGLIEYARKKSHGAACAYETGVAEALQAPDASFDVVVTSLAIHHIPAELRPAAMGEMFRVLRPGGLLLLADFRPPRSRVVRHLVGALTGPAMEHNPIDELDGLAERAGFAVRGRGDVQPWLGYVQAVRPEAAR